MHPAFTEVHHEIRQLKLEDIKTLNLFTIRQLKAAGKEVAFSKMKDSRIGTHAVNTIDKLYSKKHLTKAQYVIAIDYQRKYSSANKNHYARPRDYDQIVSSKSTKPFEPTPEQFEIDAQKYIFAIKMQLRLASNYETVKSNGQFYIRDLKLEKILEAIFEQERSINAAEKVCGVNHGLIVERVKKICDIMIDFKNPKSFNQSETMK